MTGRVRSPRGRPAEAKARAVAGDRSPASTNLSAVEAARSHARKHYCGLQPGDDQLLLQAN